MAAYDRITDFHPDIRLLPDIMLGHRLDRRSLFERIVLCRVKLHKLEILGADPNLFQKWYLPSNKSIVTFFD